MATVREADRFEQDFTGPFETILDCHQIIIPERYRFIGATVELVRTIERAFDMDAFFIRVVAHEPDLVHFNVHFFSGGRVSHS